MCLGCCRAHSQLSHKFNTFELARTAELWVRIGFGTFHWDGWWMDTLHTFETDVKWVAPLL